MDILSIIGTISGILGSVLGILNYQRNSLEALNLYFAQSRSKLITDGKSKIYNSTFQEIDSMLQNFPHNIPESIIEVINFYHHWGLMLRHHQLPLWLFYDKKTGLTASGIAVVRTFKKVDPIISRYREDNPKYAEYYIMLNEKLKDYYNDDIEER